jgi:hypothetical protein
MGHLQLVVEAIEEVAAAGIAHLQHLTAEWVELALLTRAASPLIARHLPGHRQARVARARQADHPTPGTAGVLLQVVLRQRQAGFAADLAHRDFRLHPVADLVVEVRQGTGEEDREQNPAEDQSGPGVQPGHGLTKALFHDCPNQ